MDIRLSAYGKASSRPAPVNAMMADFATDFRDGIDINLGVGYVNERTIPGPLMLEAMAAVLDDPARHRQAFNYGGPQGSPNLIEAIRQFLITRRIGRVPADTLAQKRIIIGPSGATSLLDAIAEVLAPGIVITADPMYYIYCNALERMGFEVLAIPEEPHGVDPERVEAALDRLGSDAARVSAFYFVTVNNPTCTILDNGRRRALVDLASRFSKKQGHIVPIFFDQAYELLLHDPEVPPFESALPYDDLGVVYELGTLSKVLAPALRIGYLTGPPGPFLDALVQNTSDTGFSAPLFAQEMAAYLLERHIDRQLADVNAGYRRKALEMRHAIDTALGEYLEECRGGSAGFYYYLTFKQIETHTASHFFRFLTRTIGDPAIDGPPENRAPRVIYIPGEYCVHPRGALTAHGQRQLRLSYGYEDTPAIQSAIEHLRNALQNHCS